MIHPDTEVRFINEETGYGLFALRPIERGTVTWVRDQLDREITPTEMAAYPEPLREIMLHYSFRNHLGNYMFLWDNSRFINHSFNPNCFHTPYSMEIAVRDIEAGEELTNDYGFFNIIEPFEVPGAAGERHIVFPDDLRRYAVQWDTILEGAFPNLTRVAQPLRRFFDENHWQTVLEVSLGKETMRSISTCYFDEGM